ncbi:MAG: radical SAM protein [Planctomycetaceae bacterium]|jgi:nitrogen fixation protein NifB|nr:radical SAM protein [Planctomycetaceae bacterium]
MAVLFHDKPSHKHPCFHSEAHQKYGRIHLPVSPFCNIQCRFCVRSRNEFEQRPGVTKDILKPEQAVGIVERALRLCPEITVVGIAGPGDTLASEDAVKTFMLIHEKYPELIQCLSTNGLRLPDYIGQLPQIGVKTLTVTVNAVKPEIVSNIVAYIVWNGKKISGIPMGEILVSRQLEGIRRASESGLTIKVNTVLIPGINDGHIEEIAQTVSEVGASLYNIIPLIPQGELAGITPPDCHEKQNAKMIASRYLEVFEHCKHCRADACGIPGKKDFSSQLYQEKMETFSHG